MKRMGLVPRTILGISLIALTAVSTSASQLSAVWAGSSQSDLQQACATAKIPVTKTYTLYDLATRTVLVMWRDGQGRDIELRLPYEPEIGFRGCSPSAQAHLRHVHLVFEQIDRERNWWLERAKRENIDLVKQSAAYPAVLYYGSLQANCANYKPPPQADNLGVDPMGRVIIADWWEPQLNRNVTIILYDPKTMLSACP